MVNKRESRDKEMDRDAPEKKHRKMSTVTTYELPVSKAAKDDRDVYMVCVFILTLKHLGYGYYHKLCIAL